MQCPDPLDGAKYLLLVNAMILVDGAKYLLMVNEC